ncbi:hypothetical protein H5410_055732 [Solanum commersonii]|uniref:CCHC-type domain-containing protein n=1 Tax=Solanum commersonii TaxID=4109 RepID=A0A9J5WL32_SOLCO|nr:hypothetical protein H5410_055732 [Solanum commersonii]
MILEQVGQKLGALLKINARSSPTLRGRYARICVQVPLEVSMKSEVTINTHKQNVVYEGEGIMCTGCGMLGHITKNCPQVLQSKHIEQTTTKEGPMRNPKTKRKAGNRQQRNPPQLKAYDPYSGKFLGTTTPTQSHGDGWINGKNESHIKEKRSYKSGSKAQHPKLQRSAVNAINNINILPTKLVSGGNQKIEFGFGKSINPLVFNAKSFGGPIPQQYAATLSLPPWILFQYPTFISLPPPS